MRRKEAEERIKEIKSLKTPYELEFSGVKISVLKDVYPTSELSELIVEHFDKLGSLDGLEVLDYGTGTGFLAINAALRGANVIATDINKNAIECAKFNAKKNDVFKKIDFRHGNKFDIIGEEEKFDIITAGLPWDNSAAEDLLERALYDPGFEMKKDLFEKAKEHLNFGGYILMPYCDFVEQQYPIKSFGDEYIFETCESRIIKGVNHYIEKISRDIKIAIDLPKEFEEKISGNYLGRYLFEKEGIKTRIEDENINNKEGELKSKDLIPIIIVAGVSVSLVIIAIARLIETIYHRPRKVVVEKINENGDVVKSYELLTSDIKKRDFEFVLDLPGIYLKVKI